MLPDKKQVEYRGFRGLNTRSDRGLMSYQHLVDNENQIIERGVLKLRGGSFAAQGGMAFPGNAGLYFGFGTADVGPDEIFLIHKGTKVYWRYSGSNAVTEVQLLTGAAFTVLAAPSEFTPLGFGVGSGGTRVIKVLFTQAGQNAILEWGGGSLVARTYGIPHTGLSFALSEVGGGTNQPAGTYRVRLVLQRRVNGVLVNESAHTGKLTSTGRDFDGYQEVELVSGSRQIQITATFSGLDPQVTHIAAQVTKNLDMSGQYSANGNDPTLYFETTAQAISASPMIWQVDASAPTLTVPDLFGHQPIPPCPLHHYSGGVLFFGGIAPFPNRIYKGGLSGRFYHNELYDPLDFYLADEGDGQDLTGITEVSDHLVVMKESKTGIVPNKDLSGRIIWRDFFLGMPAAAEGRSKCYGRLSKDLIVIFCQDRVVRRFDGVNFIDRPGPLDPQEYPFSDNVISITRTFSPSSVHFLFNEDRLHLFGKGEAGTALANQEMLLVLHPQEGYAWTKWKGVPIHRHHLTNFEGGRRWHFLQGDKIYQQNYPYPEGEEPLDQNSIPIDWSVAFAALHAEDQANYLRFVTCAVEAYLQAVALVTLKTNNGFIETPETNIAPEPQISTYQYVQRFRVYPDRTILGDIIELTMRGTGNHFIRSVQWEVLERRGAKPWNLKTYVLDDLKPGLGFDIVDGGGTDHDRILSQYTEMDAELGARDTSTMTTFDRDQE